MAAQNSKREIIKLTRKPYITFHLALRHRRAINFAIVTDMQTTTLCNRRCMTTADEMDLRKLLKGIVLRKWHHFTRARPLWASRNHALDKSIVCCRFTRRFFFFSFCASKYVAWNLAEKMEFLYIDLPFHITKYYRNGDEMREIAVPNKNDACEHYRYNNYCLYYLLWTTMETES